MSFTSDAFAAAAAAPLVAPADDGVADVADVAAANIHTHGSGNELEKRQRCRVDGPRYERTRRWLVIVCFWTLVTLSKEWSDTNSGRLSFVVVAIMAEDKHTSSEVKASAPSQKPNQEKESLPQHPKPPLNINPTISTATKSNLKEKSPSLEDTHLNSAKTAAAAATNTATIVTPASPGTTATTTSSTTSTSTGTSSHIIDTATTLVATDSAAVQQEEQKQIKASKNESSFQNTSLPEGIVDEVRSRDPTLNAGLLPLDGAIIEPNSHSTPNSKHSSSLSNDDFIGEEEDFESTATTLISTGLEEEIDSQPLEERKKTVESFVTLDEIKSLYTQKLNQEVATEGSVEYELKEKISTTVEVQDSDGGRRSNYASLDAGATVLDYSEGTKSASNLLVRDQDRYMLTPCETQTKWVVISLSEDIHVEGIVLANYEKFSSTMKEFWLLGSVKYPTDTWVMLGNFTAKNKNGEQFFVVNGKQHVRYLKLRFLSHYGSEYYCTLSQLMVYGRTMTEMLSHLQDIAETTSNLVPIPSTASEVGMGKRPNEKKPDKIKNPSPTEVVVELLKPTHDVCSIEFFNFLFPTTKAMYRKTPITKLKDAVPFDAKNSEHSLKTDSSLKKKKKKKKMHSTNNLRRMRMVHQIFQRNVFNVSTDPSELAPLRPQRQPETKRPKTASVTDGSATASNHAQASDVIKEGVNKTETWESQEAVDFNGAIPPKLNLPSVSMGNLGRLEAIFMTIRKKIHELQVNQSIFDRYLKEVHSQYKIALEDIEEEQRMISIQVKALTASVVSLQQLVKPDGHTMVNQSSWEKMHQAVKETNRENLILKEEILMIKNVLHTLKAGIMFAILLSMIVVLSFFLRQVTRWYRDRRESHRKHMQEQYEKYEQLVASQDENENVVLDRSAMFGSSLDDFSISRKTMYQKLIEDSNGFRKHHVEKER